MEYRYKQKGVKLRLTRKNIVVLGALLAAMAGIALVAMYYPYAVTTANYNDVVLVFGVNLRDAKNVPVYPTAGAVKDLINGPNVKKLTFVVQNTSDSYITKFESVEIVLKLSTALGVFDSGYFDNVIEVKSFDGLNATPEAPYIVLVPPSIANGTYVKVDGNAVFISGGDRRGLDLATAKFIISSLGIII